MGPGNLFLNGDCLEVMETLPAASVDCVLTDLPYGTTDNEWDQVIPMLHGEGSRGRELRSSFSTQQPFTTTVAASNLRQLKTEWIWEKARSTGFLNAKKYPLKSHENILVFCDRLPPYFPQKTMGAKPYVTRRPPSSSTNYSGDKGFVSVNTDGSRYPTSILRTLLIAACTPRKSRSRCSSTWSGHTCGKVMCCLTAAPGPGARWWRHSSASSATPSTTRPRWRD
jgi:hypothetical protein